MINLGLDYFALDPSTRALTYLEPTLERVEHEAFGAHRWRWKMKLLIGLGDLAYTTGDYDQALRFVEEGLNGAQLTVRFFWEFIRRFGSLISSELTS